MTSEQMMEELLDKAAELHGHGLGVEQPIPCLECVSLVAQAVVDVKAGRP